MGLKKSAFSATGPYNSSLTTVCSVSKEIRYCLPLAERNIKQRLIDLGPVIVEQKSWDVTLV